MDLVYTLYSLKKKGEQNLFAIDLYRKDRLNIYKKKIRNTKLKKCIHVVCMYVLGIRSTVLYEMENFPRVLQLHSIITSRISVYSTK